MRDIRPFGSETSDSAASVENVGAVWSADESDCVNSPPSRRHLMLLSIALISLTLRSLTDCHCGGLVWQAAGCTVGNCGFGGCR